MFKNISYILWTLLLLFASTSLQTAKAQDGSFGDAQTLEHEVFTLGIQPIYFTESEDGMLMFRGAYGISRGITLHGKLGLLEDNTYAGGHLEIGLASEPASEVSLSLLTGAHVWNEPGLKISTILSKRLDQVSLFSGLSYEPLFLEPNTIEPLLVPIGVDFHLSNSSANIVLEADLGVNDDGDFLQAISGGVYFYL